MAKRKKRVKIKVSKLVLFIGIIVGFIALILILFKPTIKLNGSKVLTINYNEEYEELGAKGSYFGIDKTKSIKTEGKVDTSKPGKYEIKYSLKVLLFKETVTRTIEVVDNVAPTLTLKGSETINQKLNDNFSEPGFTAEDEIDGDISSQVTVEGNVDTTKEGTYELSYKIKDKAGNETTVNRKVIVYKKIDVNSGSSAPGVIYLTFDDGPNSNTTSKILDILKDEGVKATFFVTCNGPDSLIEREYKEGHAIGLHTCSHEWTIYSSETSYYNDLNKVKDRVKRLTGQETNLIRFPGGSSNTVSKHYATGIMTRLSNSVLENGYRYYDWNVCGEDAGNCAKSSVSDKKTCVYNYTVNGLSKSRANIVLLHDIKTYTVDALRDIIRYGKNNGYVFDVLSSDVAMVRFKVHN